MKRRPRRPLWRVRLYGPAGVVAEWTVPHVPPYREPLTGRVDFETDRGQVTLYPGVGCSVVWEALP